MQDVQACKDALYAGESYELCLTTAMSRQGTLDALQLYYTLRRLSPAPYAAFLSFGADGPQVCSLPAHKMADSGGAFWMASSGNNVGE